MPVSSCEAAAEIAIPERIASDNCCLWSSACSLLNLFAAALASGVLSLCNPVRNPSLAASTFAWKFGSLRSSIAPVISAPKLEKKSPDDDWVASKALEMSSIVEFTRFSAAAFLFDCSSIKSTWDW